MVQIYRAFAGLIPLFLVALVLALAVVIVVARRRTKRLGDPRAAVAGTLLELVAYGNLVGFAILTLTPGHAQSRSLNLIPFYEVHQALTSTSGATAPVVEVVGNALLLVPFAAVAGLRWRRLDPLPATASAVFAISAVAEMLQFALGIGRVASATDVLLPTLGAVGVRLLVDVVRNALNQDPTPRPMSDLSG